MVLTLSQLYLLEYGFNFVLTLFAGIFNVYSQSNTLEKSGKLDKHVWTPEEDELLIHCMMVLHAKGELMCENGLRSGVLNTLKDMLYDLIPGCSLKAHPHIQSRIKKLKTDYGVVSDLLNLFGFGWNAERKCVTAPKAVWDEYVRAHKEVAKFQNKSFSYYDKLHDMLGKDKATGKDTQTCEDVLEELQDQTGLDNSMLEADPDTDMDISHVNTSHLEDTSRVNNQTEHISSNASSRSKKQKRTRADRDDILLKGIEIVARSFSEGLMEASDHLGMRLDRVEREKCLDGMKESLYGDLMKVEGLSHKERMAAYVKMISDESILIGFFCHVSRGEVDVIREIISP
ncbi:uncharacterized protein LOC114740731 [Neltuma alba]|uniref:uncharacterized protein LOC114740731 n=1 Tax=Neltuma alba TaxID=207710 RepID=UPI0010A49C31|nr:uncharacterized protein LOC114740731 [Prosopis alba]